MFINWQSKCYSATWHQTSCLYTQTIITSPDGLHRVEWSCCRVESWLRCTFCLCPTRSHILSWHSSILRVRALKDGNVFWHKCNNISMSSYIQSLCFLELMGVGVNFSLTILVLTSCIKIRLKDGRELRSFGFILLDFFAIYVYGHNFVLCVSLLYSSLPPLCGNVCYYCYNAFRWCIYWLYFSSYLFIFMLSRFQTDVTVMLKTSLNNHKKPLNPTKMYL